MGLKKQKETKSVDQDERKRSRDLEGLVAQLADPNPLTRRWAARDLLQYGEDASKILAEQLFKEPDKSVREVILTSMANLGDPVTVEALIRCLRSEDAMLRNEAIQVLKNLPDAVAPILDSLLKDADSDVRIFAVDILESLRHPQVVRWLLDIIETDPNVNVCATAVDLLGEVGTEEAVPALLRLKERFPQEPYILFAVDLAVKRIRGG